MNYMLEVVAFEEWFEKNTLSISAQLLWHKLMYLNYKNGWDEWVQLDNKSLMKLIEVKNESTLIKIRKELIQSGLIEYQMGKKKSPSRYKIKSILEGNKKEENAAALPKEQVIKSEESVSETKIVESASAAQVGADAKGTDKNATEIVEAKTSSSVSMKQASTMVFGINAGNAAAFIPEKIKLFDKFYEIYPKKKSKALAAQVYIDLILHTAEGTEEKILAAAENYAEECKKLKRKEKYIKMPYNWLKDFTWIDYLPENYKEESINDDVKPNVNNAFNNSCCGRKTVVTAELERALLGY